MEGDNSDSQMRSDQGERNIFEDELSKVMRSECIHILKGNVLVCKAQCIYYE